MARQQLPQGVLLTAGAGYVGGQTFVAVREAGFEPVVQANFTNGRPEVLLRVQQITGRAPLLERGDVLSTPFVEAVLRPYRPPPWITPRLWRFGKQANPCPGDGVKSTINLPGRAVLAERQPRGYAGGGVGKADHLRRHLAN